MSTDLKIILSKLRIRLQQHYGEQLVRLVLYGSQARGDAEEGSDIDVMVVLRGAVDTFVEIDKTIDIVSELSLEHDAVIACYFASEEEYARNEHPLFINVRREGVTV